MKKTASAVDASSGLDLTHSSGSYLCSIPKAAVSADVKIGRECSVMLHTWEDFDPQFLVSLSNNLKPDEFEALVEDCQDFNKTSDELLCRPRALVPPPQATRTGMLMLSSKHQASSSDEEWTSFLDVVRGAYSTGNSSLSEEKLQVTLITFDMKGVHAMEFDHEKDYWRFLSGLQDSSSQNCGGSCRLLSAGVSQKMADAEKAKTQKTLFGFARPDAAAATTLDRYEISQGMLTVNTTSVRVALEDIAVCTFTRDFPPPKALQLILEVTLPEVAKRHVNPALLAVRLRKSEDPAVEGSLGYRVPSPRNLAGAALDTVCVSFPVDETELLEDSLGSNNPATLHWKVELLNSADGKIVASATLHRSLFLHLFPREGPGAVVPGSAAAAAAAGGGSFAEGVASKATPTRSPLSPTRSTASRKTFWSATTPEPGAPPAGAPGPAGSPPVAFPPAASPVSPMLDPVSPRVSFKARSQSLAAPSRVLIKPKFTVSVDAALCSARPMDKALRLCIDQAEDLPPYNGKDPAVYCTVYMLGRDGQRLTSNHAEVRTATLQSTQPTFAKELLLQDHKLGVDEVHAVMILVRDASVGILKHRHIGQVTIPIQSFLEDVEGSLCLPLEPSYRMDGELTQHAYIGLMHVRTQLVSVVAADEAGAKGLVQAKNRRLSIYSSSAETVSCRVHCTIYRALPLHAWWPVTLFADHDLAKLTGALLCTPTALAIWSGAWAGGGQATLIEYDRILSLVTVTATTVRLQLDVSAAVAQLLGCHLPPPVAGVASTSLVLDMVVTGCAATKLTAMVAHLRKAQPARRQLEALRLLDTMAHTTTTAASGVSIANPALATGDRSVSRTRSQRFSSSGVHSVSVSSMDVPPAPLSVAQVILVLHHARAIAHQLLEIQEARTPVAHWEDAHVRCMLYFLRGPLLARLLAQVDASTCAALSVGADMSVYRAHGLHSGDLLPIYSSQGVRRCVDADCEDTQILAPLRETSRVECLADRFQSFLDAAAQRVRDYLLFSGIAQARHLQPGGLGAAWDALGPSGVGLFGPARAACEEVIMGYHAALQRALQNYVESKATFTALSVQLRHTVVTVLLRHNHVFQARTQALLLGLADCAFASKSLVLCGGVEAVVAWHAGMLHTTMQQHVGAMVQSSAAVKHNRHDLPWDVEMGDGYWAGPMVEEFMARTRATYADMCGLLAQTGVRVRDGSSVQAMELQAATLRACTSLQQSLCLPAEEWIRVLRQRSWDHPHDALEQVVARNFLVALVNDCYRMLVQLSELLVALGLYSDTLQAAGKVAVEESSPYLLVQRPVAQCYLNVLDLAVKALQRGIVSDCAGAFVDAEGHWLDGAHAHTKPVLAAVSACVHSLSNGMYAPPLGHFLFTTSELVSMRLLLHLHARLTGGNRSGAVAGNAVSDAALTFEEAVRLKVEAHEVATAFQTMHATYVEPHLEGYRHDAPSTRTNYGAAALSPARVLHTPPASEMGQYLLHFSACVYEDHDSAAFLNSALFVLHKYAPALRDRERAACSYPPALPPSTQPLPQALPPECSHSAAELRAFSEHVLLACALPLRARGGPDVQSYLLTLIEGHHDSAPEAPGAVTHPGRRPSASSASSAPATALRSCAGRDLFLLTLGRAPAALHAAASSDNLQGSGGAPSTPGSTPQGQSHHMLKNLISPQSRYGHGGHNPATALRSLNPTSALKQLIKGAPTKKGGGEADLLKLLQLDVTEASAPFTDAVAATAGESAKATGGGGSNLTKEFDLEAEDRAAEGSEGGATSRQMSFGLLKKTFSSHKVLAPGPGSEKKLTDAVAPGGAATSSSRSILTDAADAPSAAIASDAAQMGVLLLRDVEVRHLVSPALFSQAHPYVCLSVLRERVKTPVQRGAQASWGAGAFTLLVPHERWAGECLLVQVFDKERIRRKVLLGQVSLQLRNVVGSRGEWMQLEGGEHGAGGEVRLTVAYAPPSQAPL